jgi:vesicle-associated membrane protein 72
MQIASPACIVPPRHFAFLEHLEKEFTKMYGSRRIDTARAHALEKDFGPSVRSAIHHHNIHHDELKRDHKIQAIMAKVEDFKAVMGKNINLMMENTVAASNLLTLSDEMRVDAQVFKKKAKTLRRTEKRRHCFTIMMGVFVAIILLYMAMVGICGFQFKECRSSSRSSGGDNYSGSDSTSSSSYSDGGDSEGGDR